MPSSPDTRPSLHESSTGVLGVGLESCSCKSSTQSFDALPAPLLNSFEHACEGAPLQAALLFVKSLMLYSIATSQSPSARPFASTRHAEPSLSLRGVVESLAECTVVLRWSPIFFRSR